jgi:hypothetical protein
MKGNGMQGTIYGMGFLGAEIYFIEHAVTFWGGVWGFVKAVFWPAVLIYRLLVYQHGLRFPSLSAWNEATDRRLTMSSKLCRLRQSSNGFLK